MNIAETLQSHKYWLEGKSGRKPDLRWADLRWADLQGANLRGADLQGADLRGADLQGANLRWADLRGADLRWADLQGADLRWADLQGANLRGAGVAILQLPNWHVYMVPGRISIGCQSHTPEVWRGFSDDEIHQMDAQALHWWQAWKPVIFQAYEIACKPYEADTPGLASPTPPQEPA